MFVKVHCEYDINGKFGGNNDQEVFEVPDGLSESEVYSIVEKHLKKSCGYSPEELEDLLWIQPIKIQKLVK